MVRSLHVLRDKLWLMLSCLSVNNQQQEPSVEELCVEHSLGDRRLLLTLGILSYPVHQINDDQLEDHIHCDDDKGNRLPNDFGPDDIIVVLLTDGPRVYDIVIPVKLLVNSAFGLSVCLLFLAEALHCARKISLLICVLGCLVLFELYDCILLPEIMSVTVVGSDFLAVDFWVFLLFGQRCLRSGENDRERDC